MLSFASDKAKLFAKNLSKNSNLDGLGTSLPAFPSRTNLRNIFVIPKMVKKVITTLDSSKTFGSDCVYMKLQAHSSLEPPLDSSGGSKEV